MARIIYSLSEYTTIVENIGTDVSRAAIDSMRKTRERVDGRLTSAERQVGLLSRVGRATGYGKRNGARLTHKMESRTLTSLIVRARGPWPLIDNSVSGGPTKGHWIGPRHDRNPRPLPPARRMKPSLQMRGGDFASGPVWHDGSARRPLWHNTIQSVQPTIQKLFGDAWNEAIRRACN